MSELELIKHKFSNQITLHVPLYDFQTIHWLKQRTTCQFTIFHDTTNRDRNPPQLKLLQSRDIHATNKFVRKYGKTFDSAS